GGEDLAVGGHHLRGEEVVDGEPVLAHEVTDPAAGREAAHADGVGVTGGEGQAVGVGRAGEVAGGRAGLDARGPGGRVDLDPLHPREVDDERVVDDAEPGDAVPAAADRERQPVGAGERHGRGDVVRVRGADDGGRVAVDGDRDGAAGLV